MDWQAVTYGPCGARAPVTACAYCGRNNDPSAQFCMDCGKPMGKSGRLRAAAAPGGGTRGPGGTGGTGGGGAGGQGGGGGRGGPGAHVGLAAPPLALAPGEPIPCPFCGGHASA